MTPPNRRHTLVTGAAGFIGSHVSRLLADRGEAFIGVLRPGQAAPVAGLQAWPPDTFVVADLADGACVAQLVGTVQPVRVLNLAAVGILPSRRPSLDELVELNVTLPARIFESMPPDCTLIHVGSMFQYTGAPGRLREDAPRGSPDPYRWSKNAADDLLAALSLRAGTERRCVRVRQFGVTGHGEAHSRLLPSIVRALREGREIKLTDGAQVRDVLHVADVARALLHVAASPGLHGLAVNVGRGEGRSVRWLAERVAARLGRPGLLRFGALPRRAGEPDQLVADVTRLASTGWRPELGYEETVDRATDEFRATLWD